MAKVHSTSFLMLSAHCNHCNCFLLLVFVNGAIRQDQFKYPLLKIDQHPLYNTVQTWPSLSLSRSLNHIWPRMLPLLTPRANSSNKTTVLLLHQAGCPVVLQRMCCLWLTMML